MASANTIDIAPIQDEEYFGDIFSDERFILSGIDADDLLIDTLPANQEIWDVLDITDEDWEDAQPDGFFMY